MAGVGPRIAMQLMRHSGIDLTMRCYSHGLLPDHFAAIVKLPDLAAT